MSNDDESFSLRFRHCDCFFFSVYFAFAVIKMKIKPTDPAYFADLNLLLNAIQKRFSMFISSTFIVPSLSFSLSLFHGYMESGNSNPNQITKHTPPAVLFFRRPLASDECENK